MNPCVTCKHHELTGIYGTHTCVHPHIGKDKVTGERGASCVELRQPNGLCGSEGRYWDPIINPKFNPDNAVEGKLPDVHG